MRIEELSKSYGSSLVIKKFSLEVERGQKIALVGPNGAGKSTLMRIIAGVEHEFEGSLAFGANAILAYFSQESAERMESDATVEEEAQSVCPPHMIQKLRNLLGAFLFRDDDIEKPISVLSGGERSRLALLKLLLKPANLLVLDEPTNHLDLTSKDILLEALKKFDGTVIFVSHDRQFLDELAERVLELTCGETPRLYHGNYAYYLEKKSQEQIQQSEIKPEHASAAISGSSWEEEKARKARIRKLTRREEEISMQISGIVMEKDKLQRDLADIHTYSNGEKTRKILAEIESLEKKIENLNVEWLEIAQALNEE
jgi:ATP-binding cassette subfamily F protein 3